MKVKIEKLGQESLLFSDGYMLQSVHESDCCEHHWLDFEHIKLDDFEGLEFDLSHDNFFERIDGYGIQLNPIKGLPVRIAGYGSNNGYYSSNLNLEVYKDNKLIKTYDITECQNISD